MPLKYIYLLPIFEGVWYPLVFILTYTLAVTNEDVPAIFPYISDTGAWSLEKCIFSFGLGIGSLFMWIIVYIRYRQVNEILEKDKHFKPILKPLNKISGIYLSSLAALGVFMLGCFQVWPYIYIHLTAAGLAFNSGFLCLAIQTYISFKIFPTIGLLGLNIVRLIMITIIGIALTSATIFGGLSLLFFNGDDVTQWTESSGGYDFHLISVGSEWTLVLGVVVYISLYAQEFKTVVVYKPKLELIKV